MFNTATFIDIAPAKTVAPAELALDLQIVAIEDTVARYPWAAVTTGSSSVECTVSISQR